MDKQLLLSSPHMSDEGYELEYIHDALSLYQHLIVIEIFYLVLQLRLDLAQARLRCHFCVKSNAPHRCSPFSDR